MKKYHYEYISDFDRVEEWWYVHIMVDLNVYFVIMASQIAEIIY